MPTRRRLFWRPIARECVRKECHETYTKEGADGNHECTNGPQAVAARVRRASDRKADRHDQRGHGDRVPRMSAPASHGGDHGEHERRPHDLPRIVGAMQVAVGPEVLRLVPPQPADVVGEGGKTYHDGRPSHGTRGPLVHSPATRRLRGHDGQCDRCTGLPGRNTKLQDRMPRLADVRPNQAGRLARCRCPRGPDSPNSSHAGLDTNPLCDRVSELVHALFRFEARLGGVNHVRGQVELEHSSRSPTRYKS
jgi:hypothetical protein